MHTRRRAITTSLALLWAWSSAQGQASPDRVIINAELERTLVTDVRFEPGRLVYTSAGREASAPLDGSVVALVEPSGRAPRPRDSWVELADGQRFVGMPVFLSTTQAEEFARASGDTGLAWSTPLLGNLRVPLEALRRVVLREEAEPAEYDDLNDVLVLSNGDRTRGLLERVWPDVVLDVDGQSRSFDLSEIASITLANPEEEPVGSRVWLSDGSIVAVDALETVPDGVSIDLAEPVGTPDQTLASLTMNEVLAVAFESGGVVPLAALGEPRWQRISSWTLPPEVGDPDRELLGSASIELIGPVSAAWDIPTDVRRVAIRARLRDDCRVWGDCDVTVRVGGRVAFTERLNAAVPQATFTIDLPPVDPAGGSVGPLEVRVDEGLGGAIQDRVLLDGFVLLSSDAG
ncbi:MAG: hypothetical protein RIE77_02300 [Phycisphaerales bacterium]|jgi:hypothetical protein